MIQRQRLAQALFLQAFAVAICALIFALESTEPAYLYVSSFALTVFGAASALVLFRTFGVLAPVGFYMFGSTVYFGFGAIVAVDQSGEFSLISFGADAQGLYLPQANFINALAAFIVVSVSAIFIWDTIEEEQDDSGLRWALDALSHWNRLLILMCLIGFFLQLITFPAPESGFTRSFLSFFAPFQLLFILITTANWERSPNITRLIAVIACLMMFALGVLYFSKTRALLPILIFCVGLLMSKHNKYMGGILLFITFALYFLFLAPFVAFGRLHDLYDPDLNLLNDRLTIAIDILRDFSALVELSDSDKLLRRFSVVPFQSVFMAFHDGGMPGSSIVDGTFNLIPRFFWPEKPFFDPGRDFNMIIYDNDGRSSLAISYLGEAYWNFGWWGALIIPFVMAISVGWFSRKWVLFVRFGSPHIGVFLLSPLIAWSSNAVEANVIGGIVAGPLRLIILVLVIDYAFRLYRNSKQLADAT